MKKVTRKVKQALSILLVAAMVITMVPQNTLAVSAEEAVETVTETETVETTVTDETEETKSDTENVDETENSDEDADAEKSDEEEADVETDETDTEETVDEETEETEDQESEEGIKKGALDAEVMADSSYTVTVENKESINATVAYTNNCVTGENAIEADTDLTFTVTPADDYKVTGVKYTVEGTEGDQDPAYDSANKVYTIAQEKITGNVTIKVTTVALADYTITFDVAEGATVKITGESAEDITKDSPRKYVIVKENAGISFTVDVASGYTLDDVTATDKTGELTNVEGTYTFAPTNASTITVTATPVPKNTVTFVDNAEHMTYEVNVTDKVKAVDGEADKYSVADGAESLGFTITAASACKEVPVVTNSKKEKINPVGDAETTETGTTVYTYSVVAQDLAAEETLTITEEAVTTKYNVSVVYATSGVEKVEFTVDGEKADGVETSADDTGKTTAKLPLEEGKKVSVTVTAKNGYKITKASKKVGDADPKDATVNAPTYTYEVTVGKNDVSTTITTEALTEAVLLKEGEPEAAAAKYSVSVGDVYTAQLKVGGVAQTLTDVKAKVGNNAVEGVVKIIEGNETTADIKVLQAVAGKEVTVTLTSEAGEATLVLSVAKAPKSVTVAGVKNNVLAQSVGTEKKYKITMTPKDAADTLAVECVSTAGVTAVLAEGNLVVTVPATATVTEEAATITVYDKNDAEKTPLTNGKAITVSATALLKDVTPTVALKSATDTHLTLALGSKVAAEDLADSSKLYYKVVVTTDNKDINFAANDALYFEREGAAQEEKIQVITGAPGDGSAADFQVEVTLVQTRSGELNKSNEADNTVCQSKTAGVAAATKAPYFTTKLGSKKLNGGVAYTGQTVQVAQITFDKDATYKGLKVTDYDYSVFTSAKIVDGDKLQVTVNTGLEVDELGKKTITVSAIDETNDKYDNLYVAKTTVNVTVQKGIEKLTVTAPKTVYKQSGKAASFSAGITYNDNDKATAPKKKTVLWSIKAANGVDAPNENIAKNVTVKNGKVTINKNFVVSDTASENQFTVVAKAADYAGNNAEAKSDVITVTAEKAELGELIIVDDEDNVIARSGDTVSADKLNSTYAKVLKKGAEEKDQYSAADYADAEVVFSSGNKKVLDINAKSGKITVLKTGRGLKITATATDGSKAKAELKNLIVGYTATEELGLEIEQLDFEISSIIYNSYECKIGDEDSYKENGVEQIEYYGAVDTCFQIYLKQFNASSGKWDRIKGIADYKLKVVGAKTVYSENGYFNIIAQKNPVTITLTQNASDKEKKKVKTYVLKNLALNTTTSLSAKTRDTLYGGEYPKAQQVTYTLSSSKGYDFKDKYALVTLNTADVTGQKDMERYMYFICNAPSVGGYIPVNADGTIDLCFKYSLPGIPVEFTAIPVGSYKLNISVGTVNADGTFVADTKTATVTLKAVAQKAVSSKLNAKYTMSTKAGAKAPLTLSNKQTYLTDATLLNANIKGQQNDFTEYFEIEVDPTEGFILKLKDDLDQAKLDRITGKDGKNDLTGWIAYEYSDVTYSGPYPWLYSYKGETQVTVSFKDAKYSLSKTTVFNDAATATVSLYAGKEAADVSDHVLVEGTDFTYKQSDDSEIVLNITDVSKLKKSNKVTLYVVPADSKAVSILDGLKAGGEGKKTDYENAIKAYGVKLTTTVSVTDKASTTKKISIASKDLKKTFTADQYFVSTKNHNYEDGVYWVEIPYTRNVDATISAITVNGEDNAKLFSMEAEEDCIIALLSKKALQEAVSNQKAAYGGKCDVKATVAFGEGTKSEEFTFKFTLPKKAMTYAEVCEQAEAALNKLNGTTLWFDKWNDDADEVKESIFTSGSDVIYVAAESLVEQLDSDVSWKFSDIGEVEYKVPTSTEAGSMKFTITLHDQTAADTSTDKQIKVTFNLDATGAVTSDLSDKLEVAVAKLGTEAFPISNATTEADILKFVRDELKISEYPALRLCLENFKLEPASISQYGSITGTLVLKDIKNGSTEIEKGFGLTIAQLDVLTINSKDASKTFTAKELDVDYEVVDKKGYYIVEVPYTTTVESVAELTVDAVNDADKAMLKVTVDQENKKLVVKLDKAALAENVKNTGTTGVAYGQSRAVEFTLTVADNAATQKITLNLTLPKEATANYTSVTQVVVEALKDVNTGVYYGGDIGETVEANILYIEGLIRDLVPADSDTRLDVESVTPPSDPYVTLPTSGNTGRLSISVQLTDLTQDGVYTIMVLDLTLAAL